MKKHIKLLVVLGIILVGGFSFYLFKGYKKDTVVYENNKIKPSSSEIAMMLETSASSGNYEMTTRSEWPTEGYIFNSTLSKCENGGELLWDDTKNVVLMAGNISDKCYVYFDVYVAPVVNDVSYSAILLAGTDRRRKIEILVTKGTADIKTYYYSIDNGQSYISSDKNYYSFTMDSYKTYDCIFYVEDINGVKSNVFSKQFLKNVPSRSVVPLSGTIITEDGEIRDINNAEELGNYLALSNSSLETETIVGYSALAIFEVNFINITAADAIYEVPGISSSESIIIVKQYVSGKWNIIDASVVADNLIKFKLTQPGTIAIYYKTS